MQPDSPDSVSVRLEAHIHEAIAQAGGWLAFDRFMALALYAPGLGYYARGATQIGRMPEDGSDFVTAPVLSPLFGRALARQIGQALQASGTDEVWEFGAGTGALAAQLLESLGARVRRYTIVDLSGALGAHQRQALARFGERVRWLDRLPASIEGVILGNEVLDATPVQLLAFDGHTWAERGVASGEAGGFEWADAPSDLRPPVQVAFVAGSVTELHPHAHALVRTLADKLRRGAAFFIDYGFPEAEYYLPERIGGTLMCHRAHRADGDPLADVGEKDITAHVDFTGVALAAQEAGLDVLGYTSQAHFLINCGLLDDLLDADVRARAGAHPLIAEHEMGELFKVIGLARGCSFEPIGFVNGDRSHRL